MMKPLAIDLFCGLLQAKRLLAANAVVQKLVACRAKNPEHVPLRVGHEAVCPAPLEAWLVGDLYNSAFAARLTCRRQIRVLSTKARETRVPVRSPRVVSSLRFRMTAMKHPSLSPRSFARAILRAVSPISVGWCDGEVLATACTVSPRSRDVALLTSAPATGASLAWRGAIELVRPLSDELFAAVGAKQIVHKAFMP